MMKKNITPSLLMGFLLAAGVSHAQIRIANSTTNFAVSGSSAFIDASSNTSYNATTNVGKGLLYPRTDLSTFTAFGGAPIDIPTSFPTRYDGFIVYNTKEGGVAGVGTTQGTLTAGFWYYENKSTTINGGTWKPFTTAGGATTNVLSSSGNNITSNINGISSTTSAVNSNALSLSGSSLTSTVNGITSNSLNLDPAITAATTNVLALSGSNLTSTINGVASTTNLTTLIASATTNTLVSGGTGNNTITSTVNGVAANTTAVKTVSNTSSGNNLSTTVNGVTGTAVPVINNNTLSLSGSNLTSTVNGVASSAVNLAPAITAATTHTLSISGNTLTSNVNGIAPTVSVVTSNTLTKPTTNTMVSTVNGVASAPATIISNVSNTLTGSLLTTTVNGITGASVDLSGTSKNIYNTDDTFTSNRTASMSGRWLWFNGSSSNTSVEKISIGATSPASMLSYTRLKVDGAIQFGNDTDYGITSIFNDAIGEKYGLTQTTYYNGSPGTRIYTSGRSIVPGHITFGKYTSATSYTPWVFINTNGNFGIGTTAPSEKLDVAGNIKATGSLISGTTTYPDYVFENYYNGFSNINPNYAFKKLNEVEEFIKEKGHLPGYVSIDEVKKNDMTVDITQNSITNMEKIEELYLHVIEQSKQIEKLQKEINKLKNIQE